MALRAWHRNFRQQHDGRLGFSDRQLRLVARHRPCGHADLGAAAADPAEMARIAQPVCRDDDAVRRLDGRAVSDLSSGPALLSLLDHALSERSGPMAAMAQRAWSGISGRSAPTSSFRRCSGMPASFPISRMLRDRREPSVAYAGFMGLLHWAGAARHGIGDIHERFYRYMAALAIPLVVSVHSIVSLDFAASLEPGWQDTIYPPYFVVGALYSGFRDGCRHRRNAAMGLFVRGLHHHSPFRGRSPKFC